jgi:PAS domain-containing protein
LGFLALISLGGAISLIGWSWESDAQRRREWQESFQEISKVMYSAESPYARLDADDRIINANLAFCEFLNLPRSDQSIEAIMKRTFQSFIAPQSSGVYAEVQRKRRDNLEVDSYELVFRRDDGTEARARIFSAKVPSSKASRTALPETFGILLRC